MQTTLNFTVLFENGHRDISKKNISIGKKSRRMWIYKKMLWKNRRCGMILMIWFNVLLIYSKYMFDYFYTHSFSKFVTGSFVIQKCLIPINALQPAFHTLITLVIKNNMQTQQIFVNTSIYDCQWCKILFQQMIPIWINTNIGRIIIQKMFSRTAYM